MEPTDDVPSSEARAANLVAGGWINSVRGQTITYTFLESAPAYFGVLNGLYPTGEGSLPNEKAFQQITAALEPSPAGLPPVGAFTEIERQYARRAFDLYKDVCDLNFVETQMNNVGEIAFAKYDMNAVDARNARFGGEAVWQIGEVGKFLLHTPIDHPDRVYGDINLNLGASPSSDQDKFRLIFHEIGHSLGLKHSFQVNVGSEGTTEATNLYSVMNYNIYKNNYETTAMLYDIFALQEMYGESKARSGDTRYFYNPYALKTPWLISAEEITDNLSTIWDSGGRDWIDARALRADGIIDLRQGHFSSIQHQSVGEWNVAIAFKAVIEDATGGHGDDLIIGNGGKNRLEGGRGHDRLFGDGAIYGVYRRDGDKPPSNPTAWDDRQPAGEDNDTLVGGAGDDELYGGTGNDSLDGGGGNDRLDGGDGDDALIGLDPKDTLEGGAGRDTLIGGKGTDVADFSGAEGVELTLLRPDPVMLASAAEGGAAELPPIADMEVGSSMGGRDLLVEVERLKLGAGNDTVKAQAGAFDRLGSGKFTIDGGEREGGDKAADHDVLDYSAVPAKVKLTLDGGNERDGEKLGIAIGDGSKHFAEDFEKLKLGAGADVVKFSSGRLWNLKELDTGAGNDVVDIANGIRHAFYPADGTPTTIRLGDGDDLVKGLARGMVVYGGAGKDKFHLSKDTGIMDAGAEDELWAYGGNVRAKGTVALVMEDDTESQWAEGRHGLRYGLNAKGELLVQDRDGNTQYVANYQGGPDAAQHTLGIYLAMAVLGPRSVMDLPEDFARIQRETVLKVAKFTAYDLGAGGIDPLVVDLDGDGVELVSFGASGVRFDLDADGFAEPAGWAAGDDGLLFLDEGGDGVVTRVSELFGGPSGPGLAELATYDANGDGRIDAADPVFAALRVWRDRDGDGATDPGEALALAEAGIASIGLAGTAPAGEAAFVAGNQVAATAAATTTTGEERAVADVLFRVDNFNSEWLGTPPSTARVDDLPDLHGHGTLAGLRVSAALSPALEAALRTHLPLVGADLGLEAMRDAAMPILSAWADALPRPPGAPGGGGRHDFPFLVMPTEGGFRVVDFGYQEASGGGSWRLASGRAVVDAEGEVIEGPGYGDILAQERDGATWEVLTGEQLRFLERLLGEPLPLGEPLRADAVGGQAVLDAYTSMAETLWAQLNLAAVRLASQPGGALAPFFAAGVAYDAARDDFVPTTRDQFAPLYGAVLASLPADRDGALERLAAWKPVLDVVMGDYDRGGAHLLKTYGWVFQNVVKAHDDAPPLPSGLSLREVAVALGVPDAVLKTAGADGAAVGTGGEDVVHIGAGTARALGNGAGEAYTGGGNDAYVVGKDWGQATIVDDEVLVRDHDTVRFAHLRPEDVAFRYDGVDLVVEQAGTGNALRVAGQVADGFYLPLFYYRDGLPHGIDEVVFADGTVWGRTEIARAAAHRGAGDSLHQGVHAEVEFFDDADGNDTLAGMDASDVYAFGRGYGRDAVREDVVLRRGVDAVQLAPGVEPGHVRFRRGGEAGEDLVLELLDAATGAPTGDALTVEGQFRYFYDPSHFLLFEGTTPNEWFKYSVELVRFADGAELDFAAIAAAASEADRLDGDGRVGGVYRFAETVRGTAGDEWLDALGGGDTYLYEGGRDTIQGHKGDVLDLGPAGAARDGVVIRRVERPDERGDLEIALADGSGGGVLLRDALTAEWFHSGYDYHSNANLTRAVDAVRFADGAVLDLDGLMAAAAEADRLDGDGRVGGVANRAETVRGTAGDEWLDARGGRDTYLYEGGRDTVHGHAGDALDLGPAGVAPGGVAVSRPGNGADAVLRFADGGGSVTLKDQFGVHRRGVEEVRFADGAAWGRADIARAFLAQAATAGGDSTVGFGSADAFGGGAGDDTLDGGGGDDALEGGDGDDSLVGGAWSPVHDGGNDTLDGGAGDDRLEGGAGGDLYLFGRGSGRDTIVEEGGAGDAVLFGADVAPADVLLSRAGADLDDLVLSIAGAADRLTIRDHFARPWFGGPSWTVEELRFADGTAWRHADVMALLSGGTAGPDTLVGGDAAEALGGLGGADRLEGRGGDDTLDGGAGDDGLFGGDGADTLDGGEGGDGLLGGDGADALDGGAGADTLDGGEGDDALAGGGGGDSLRGGTGDWTDSGHDTLDGGAGDDLLDGGGGGDLYLFGRGSGRDAIAEARDDGRDDAVLLGAGVAPGDLLLSRAGPNGDDLVIALAGAADGLTVRGHYARGWYGEASGSVEELRFADGAVWREADIMARLLAPTGGADRLVGHDAPDAAAGAGGDDTLEGWGGADTLDGGEGNDSLLGGAGDDGLGGGAGADTLDGGEGNDALDGGAGDDALEGGRGDDLYLFGQGGGHDRLADGNSGDAGDTLLLGAGLASGAVTVGRDGAHAKLGFAGQAGSLTLVDTFWGGNWGVDRVRFADGVEWGKAELQQAYVAQAQTAGDDTIHGFAGDTTFAVDALAGRDRVRDDHGGDTADVLTLGAGLDSSDVLVTREGADAVLSFAGQAGSLTLVDSFWGGGWGVDQVQFADGVVWGKAELQQAYLAQAQTAGNDTVEGFGGDTTFTVDALAGHDTIVAKAAGGDRLVFGAGLASTDVVVARSASGHDARLGFAGREGSVTLKDEFWGGGWGVEQVQFGDGVVWGRAELLNACIA